MPRDVPGLAERMYMDSVGDLACHAQHPRVHRSDVDLRIRRVDRARAPLWRDEVEAVKVAAMVELSCPECREARLHRQHVVPQPRTRTLELHAVAPDHVRSHLRAESESELAVRRLLQLPRR